MQFFWRYTGFPQFSSRKRRLLQPLATATSMRNRS